MVWACGPCGTTPETAEDELEYVPEDSTWSFAKSDDGKTETHEVKSLLDEDTGATPDATDQRDTDVGIVHDENVTVVSGLTTPVLTKITEEVDFSVSAFDAGTSLGTTEIRDGPEEETAAASTTMSRNVDDMTVSSESTAALKTLKSVRRAVAKYMKKINPQRRKKKNQSENVSVEVSYEDTLGNFDDISVNTNVLFEALLDARSRKTKRKADQEKSDTQTLADASVDASVESTSEPAVAPEVKGTVEPAVGPAAEAAVEPKGEKGEELIVSMTRSPQNLHAELISTAEKSAEENVPASSSFHSMFIKKSSSNDTMGISLSHLSHLMNYRKSVQKELQMDLPEVAVEPEGEKGEELIISMSRSSQNLHAELISTAEQLAVENVSTELSSFHSQSINRSTSNDTMGIALSRLSDLMNYRKRVLKELKMDLLSSLSADSGSSSRERDDDKIKSMAPEVMVETVLST
jgi:hypothetical protein